MMVTRNIVCIPRESQNAMTCEFIVSTCMIFAIISAAFLAFFVNMFLITCVELKVFTVNFAIFTNVTVTACKYFFVYTLQLVNNS